MNKSLRVFAVVFFGVAVGCVVIPDTFEANINITIRHIEQQADDFWDEVEGDAETTEESDAEHDISYLKQFVDFMSPVQIAYAQTSSTSPRLDQIKAKIKQRYAEVQRIKKTGAVGESNRGMLNLARPEKISDIEQKNEIQRVVAAENKDRKALYKEIARLNKDQNMTVSTVENVHSASLRKRAKPGDLVQAPKAGDEFDKFKITALGKKLGGKAKPGAWVTVP